VYGNKIKQKYKDTGSKHEKEFKFIRHFSFGLPAGSRVQPFINEGAHSSQFFLSIGKPMPILSLLVIQRWVVGPVESRSRAVLAEVACRA
jgi:hypothetical protein